MARNLTQRHQEVRPVWRASPSIRAPTRLWRCWVVCWWCCVFPPPGWVPLRWWSWLSSHSPVPSSSPGSAATGTSSSSPSTTRDMSSPHGRSRPPSRNSGKPHLRSFKKPSVISEEVPIYYHFTSGELEPVLNHPQACESQTTIMSIL